MRAAKEVVEEKEAELERQEMELAQRIARTEARAKATTAMAGQTKHLVHTLNCFEELTELLAAEDVEELKAQRAVRFRKESSEAQVRRGSEQEEPQQSRTRRGQR